MNEHDAVTKAELDKALQSVLSATNAIADLAESHQRPGFAELGETLHELEVHQIALDLENRGLRDSREESEAALDHSASLYDFAPVGYMTLDRNGCIQEINLTGATILGRERSRLKRKPFVAFVAPSDTGTFLEHLWRCAQCVEEASVELDLTLKGGGHIQVQLVSIPLQDRGSTVYRTAISDITARKLTADELERHTIGCRLAWIKEPRSSYGQASS